MPLFLVDSSFMLPFSFFQIYSLLLLFCNFYRCAILEFIHSTIFLTEGASPTADHRLWACGPPVVTAHGLQSTGSVFVVYGHSCSKARGIFQDRGSNLCPLHWQVDSLPLSHQISLGNIVFFASEYLISAYMHVYQYLLNIPSEIMLPLIASVCLWETIFVFTVIWVHVEVYDSILIFFWSLTH